MSRPLILLLAYHFPPSRAVGGARPHRVYKYMKRLGYDCHVLTAVHAGDMPREDDVQYVADPLHTNPRQGVAWQAERIGWKFLFRGDLALGWSDAAYRIALEFIQRNQDRSITILSTAPPLGTHLTAWRLAAKTRRPWIADFRDPLVGPAGEDAVFTAVAPRLERTILRAADLVLANTDSIRNVWVQNYGDPKNRIHVLWNGFDKDDGVSVKELPPRNQKIISHVGELYGGRDARPIFLAFDRLLRKGKIQPSSYRIRQIGAAQPTEVPPPEFIARATAEGWLEMRDPVPHAEAKRLACESDGLLLVQPHTGVQVPGKLFEYVRMGRSILTFVVKGSPVERILERSGVSYTCIYPEQHPDEMEERILSYLQGLGSPPREPSDWFHNTFEASRQALELDRLIRSMKHT